MPALGVLVAALVLLPMGFVLFYVAASGWGEIERLVLRARTAELLWNTARLIAGSVLACALLGMGAAWLTERTTVPWRGLWRVLLVAPLAIPAFVNSYSWVSLLPGASGYGGALLIVTLSYFPLVYLPVAAALRGLDPALEESALTLGRGPLRVFWDVVLPQLRPALAGGCLLVGLHLLAEFGALQLLRFPTFAVAIYAQYQSSFNGPAANMLAAVLLLCCLLLLLGEVRLRGRARYARVGSGAARPAPRVRLRGLKLPAAAALTLLTALSLGLPLASLGYWLARSTSSVDPIGPLWTAAATSLGLGSVAALVTVGLALPVAWLDVRRPGRVARLVEGSTYFGNALPGIVVALALVTISVRVVPELYQSVPLVIGAYAILFLPRAVVSVRAALVQAPRVLDDVAFGLGLSPVATLRRVTLPLTARGLGAGAALVFIAAVTELTATLLVAPTGTRTLATQFWAYSDGLAYGSAAPYAAVMVLLSAPATYLLTRALGRAA